MNPLIKTRVLLIDDHPIVSSGIAAVIADEPDLCVIAQATSALEAIDWFQREQPDVALVDVMLPDRNGIDLIDELRGRWPSTRFLVLTARTAGGDVKRALAAGASAYLFKNAPCNELLGAIRIVAQGGRYVSPAVVHETERTLLGSNLTLRELEVLRRITRGHGNRKLSADLGISQETVKSHIKNILLKLGVESRSQAGAMCLKLGLMHAEEL